MDHIDAQDLLPPLQVVKALSRNDVASLSLVKNYMGRKIEKERKEMERVDIGFFIKYFMNFFLLTKILISSTGQSAHQEL